MLKITVTNNSAECPGDNTFSTITDALMAIKDSAEPACIFIRDGIYKEKVTVSRPYITFIGESKENTIITYDDHAFMEMPDGSKCGTFRSYTFFVDSHDISFSNITFENSSGFGAAVGQALALYVDGDRIIFDNCCFLGSQDTLFTGPLPPTAYKPGGFTGPKEFAERINGRHYYHNCFIRGDIDFIFGSATAYFENCEIFAQKTEKAPAPDEDGHIIYSYITAASTAEGQEYGYVFNNCKITGNTGKGGAYLGRPWRNYAKTVFMNCFLDDIIHKKGWHDWNKADSHETIFYAEYNNYGPGFVPDERAGFARLLTSEEAEHFSKEKVLSGEDGWLPKLN